MSVIKTKPSGQDVDDFLRSIEPGRKRNEIMELKKLFDDALEEKAVVWNNNMVGYGLYHYKSERSSQEGDWPLTGFSPRKQNIAIYIMPGVANYRNHLEKLGKHKVSSGSCIYINKIEDINTDILKQIITESVNDMKRTYMDK